MHWLHMMRSFRDSFDDLDQEIIPRDRRISNASTIGQQLLQRARVEAYQRGRPNDVALIRELANKMANRFTSNILASIDDELKYTQGQ